MAGIKKFPIPLTIMLIFLLQACTGKISVPPILLLSEQADFGNYTGEILKAEGFNEFMIDSLSGRNISASFIRKFDLVILSEPVTDTLKWKLFREYVRDGGNLIAIDPARPPADLFGIMHSAGGQPGDCLETDTSFTGEKFLAGNRFHIHTAGQSCILKGATAVAWFCTESGAGKRSPAVVMNRFGKGNAAAFLYNLPASVVYTRQGNPELAGVEKDGIPGLRAMDMFTDGWVDATENIINQADRQMTLLSHCIESMNLDRKPLPRLWYFPDTLKCLVTLTNDGEFRGEKDFEPQLKDVDSMGAKMSLYILQTDKVSRPWTGRWIERGFEISGHPDDTREALQPRWADMELALTGKMKEMSDLFGIRMTTVVNHWFVWCGNDSLGRPEFAAQAEIEAGRGLSLDVNYAHYDNNSSQGHFLGKTGPDQGNFTGSGLPMRFTADNGRILDIFQHLNNVYDQQYNENHDPEGFFGCFRGLMDRSLSDEVYTFISIKSHNDEYYFSKAPLLKMLGYAGSRKIPVWTAAHLLEFIRTRDEARFSNVSWADNRLSFTLNSSLRGKDGLTLMVPHRYGNMFVDQITVDGKPVPFFTIPVKGARYAFGTVIPGKDYVLNVRYAR